MFDSRVRDTKADAQAAQKMPGSDLNVQENGSFPAIPGVFRLNLPKPRRRFNGVMGLTVAAGVLVTGVAHQAVAASPAAEPVNYVIQAEPPSRVTRVPLPEVEIDRTAVLELSALLERFEQVIQHHEIGLNPALINTFQVQRERLGILQPVAVTFAGQLNSVSPEAIGEIHLEAEMAALIDDLQSALEDWISLFATPTSVPLAASGNTAAIADINPLRVAPNAAGRSGARSNPALSGATVTQLSTALDTWLANEAVATEEAAAQRAAELRDRMVALSRAHGNGRLPAEALCPIPFSTRFTMRCDVIDSLVDLNDAFRAHFGRDLQVSSGYRANPGNSNHGWGLAVDFGGQMTSFGTAEFNWMRHNAPAFGWGHAFWAAPGGINPQPWHWEAMDEIRELRGSWR